MDLRAGRPRGAALLGRQHRTKLKEFKTKDLIGLPWRVVFAMQDDGWWFRRDIIWEIEGVKPENVEDRPSKGHEFVMMFSRAAHYHYEASASTRPRVDGKGEAHLRTVWKMSTSRWNPAAVGMPDLHHHATYPLDLVRRCVSLGAPQEVCGEWPGPGRAV